MALVTLNVLVTGSAGSQPPPPAWLATTLTSPAPVKVSVTAVFIEFGRTGEHGERNGRPLEAVADSSTTSVVTLVRRWPGSRSSADRRWNSRGSRKRCPSSRSGSRPSLPRARGSNRSCCRPGLRPAGSCPRPRVLVAGHEGRRGGRAHQLHRRRCAWRCCAGLDPAQASGSGWRRPRAVPRPKPSTSRSRVFGREAGHGDGSPGRSIPSNTQGRRWRWAVGFLAIAEAQVQGT